MYLAEVWVSSH